MLIRRSRVYETRVMPADRRRGVLADKRAWVGGHRPLAFKQSSRQNGNARGLDVSERTVHKHLENLYEALGVDGRVPSTVKALEWLRP